MKSHPILFSAPMVRAILDGRKSMTRRIMNPQPVYHEHEPHWRWKKKGCKVGPFAVASGDNPSCFGKYVVGDRLWVRETWRKIESGINAGKFDYRADDPAASGIGFMPWRPSIFMPREACRFTLEITGVKVERLQDISQADAMAEGFGSFAEFATLWGVINGPDSWDANSWVWCVSFKRIGGGA